MTHDMVDRDASREGNSTFEFLALLAGESLFHLVLNHVIDGVADSGDISAWDSEFLGLEEAG